ncbi:MAG TPA: TIM barrel protein [Thermomicrobiales bacterium]|nr:TIM barrel protein [Thermomicrobiales bacterium]
MPKLAANLTMLFTEYPPMERFQRAADAGFTGVEYLLPYGDPAEDVRARLDAANLFLVLMNLPAGDWAAGDRGIAAQPSRQVEFRRGVEKATEYARVLHPPKINCLAGRIGPEHDAMDILAQNVRHAASSLEILDIRLVVEPVNSFDVNGFALPTTQAALDLIAAVDHPNLGLQFDVYHSLRMGEDPFAFIRDHGRDIAHIQIADVPGRHQPGTGSIDFTALFHTIDQSGYEGWVSLEYVPEGPTESGFGLLREMGYLGG